MILWGFHACEISWVHNPKHRLLLDHLSLFLCRELLIILIGLIILNSVALIDRLNYIFLGFSWSWLLTGTSLLLFDIFSNILYDLVCFQIAWLEHLIILWIISQTLLNLSCNFPMHQMVCGSDFIMTIWLDALFCISFLEIKLWANFFQDLRYDWHCVKFRWDLRIVIPLIWAIWLLSVASLILSVCQLTFSTLRKQTNWFRVFYLT